MNVLKFLAKIIEPPRTPDPSQSLFPGAEKPTTTLAKMIATEVLKADLKPNVTVYMDKDNRFNLAWVVSKKHVTPNSTDIRQACNYFIDQGYEKARYTPKNYNDDYSWGRNIREKAQEIANGRAISEVVSLKCAVPDVTFSASELEIIVQSLNKALELAKTRELDQIKYDNQQRAVDAIANWMGVPAPCPLSSADSTASPKD